MRKAIFILLAVLISPFLSAQEPAATEQENMAVIYFFRLPAYAGSAAKMTIMSNNEPIVRLRNSSYFKYSATPGTYIFSFNFGSDSKVTLNAEAGKEYYIKCYFNIGMWSGIAILEPVDPASGKMILEGNRLTRLTPEVISTEPRNSRLSLILGGGIGFDSYPFFIDENNNEVTLSTGGGFAVGIEYGHRFGKVFDLSFDALFQSGSLSETLRNASASYNRVVVTATPALVIPIKKDMHRFRLGAGPGLYALGTMKVDASEIDYTKYTFKYKTAIGFHGVFLFETNFMERGSMILGVKYTSVGYEYTTEGSSHMVTDHRLLNPDGSAIDFFIGYSLQF